MKFCQVRELGKLHELLAKLTERLALLGSDRGGLATVAEARVAMAGGVSKASLSRRAVIDLPLPVATVYDRGPGAEFEPASPLDVPAFLRRQSEG